MQMAKCIRWASRRNSDTNHALFIHVCDSLFDLKIQYVHIPLQDNHLAHRYLSPTANVSSLQVPHRKISNLLLVFVVAKAYIKKANTTETRPVRFIVNIENIISLQNALIYFPYIALC